MYSSVRHFYVFKIYLHLDVLVCYKAMFIWSVWVWHFFFCILHLYVLLKKNNKISRAMLLYKTAFYVVVFLLLLLFFFFFRSLTLGILKLYGNVIKLHEQKCGN